MDEHDAVERVAYRVSMVSTIAVMLVGANFLLVAMTVTVVLWWRHSHLWGLGGIVLSLTALFFLHCLIAYGGRLQQRVDDLERRVRDTEA